MECISRELIGCKNGRLELTCMSWAVMPRNEIPSQVLPSDIRMYFENIPTAGSGCYYAVECVTVKSEVV